MTAEPARARPAELRAWQAEALNAWVHGGRRGIAEVATGGGKTRFALACAAAFEQTPPTVLVIVPTAALADQWMVSIAETINIPIEEVAALTSRSTPANIRRFNVAIINSARALPKHLLDGQKSFLIVDECHRAGSPVNAYALDGDWSATLGLSATPRRQYDNALDEVLIPHLGPIFYRYTLQDAARDGVLNDFELTNIRIDRTTIETSAKYASAQRELASGLRSKSDSSVENLPAPRAWLSNSTFARLPTAVHLVELNRGARQIVFHEAIDAAEQIYSMLRSRGHSATIYHSKLGSHMRRENLRLFRRGVYDTLVTCRALDEGVDVPEAEVAVIAAATASDRQRIQRLGRVLRSLPGKPCAQVYTIYETDSEEQRLVAESSKLDGVAAIKWARVEVH